MKDDKTWTYILGFGLILVLLIIGYKVISVTVGPVQVEFEPPARQMNSNETNNDTGVLPTAVIVPTDVSFPISIDGVWDGSYSCLGGVRNVRSTIANSTTSQMQAEFYYYASADSPDTESGSFILLGSYNSRTGVIQLETASADEQYIEGIYGSLSPTGAIFEGNISHSVMTSCSWIKVYKTQ